MENTIETAKQFAIKAHSGTNHYYDTYLPYEFHLRMVVKIANDFLHLVEEDYKEIVISACWMHDAIEDARCSYNDVKGVSCYETAEIVRACTNYTRGRNREERMPIECYEDIRMVKYALFVKLCDRIANVQYSKMTGSRMFEMYRKENSKFYSMLTGDSNYTQMWDYLNSLFQ